MVNWTEVPADKGQGAKQEQDQGEGDRPCGWEALEEKTLEEKHG